MKKQQILQLFMLLLSICSKALDINSTSNLTALSTLFIAINGTYINSSIVYSNLTSPIANLSSSLTVNAINDSSIELSNVSSMTSASSVVISNSVMPPGSNSSNASSLALNMSTMNITNTSIAVSTNISSSSSYLLATLSSFPSLPSLPTPTTSAPCPSLQPWPQLEFFLPLHLSEKNAGTYGRNNEWKNMLMRSLLLFFPLKESNATIRLLLDEELRNTTPGLIKTHVTDFLDSMQKELGSDFPHVEITYHQPKYRVGEGVPPNNVTVYRTGHDRQQYMMLNADQFSNSEYVAFVDGDTFFHSYTDVTDLFENGKPIIHGTIQYFRKNGPDIIKKEWAFNTHEFLGDEEPMICMSYFPIIFRAADLKKLREYVESKRHRSFDDIFYDKTSRSGRYSQFNIICAYLFWHQRDDYTWYIHDLHPNWNGFEPKPYMFQWSDKSVFSKEMLKPRPYVATHLQAQFYDYNHLEILMIDMITQSFCFKLKNSQIRILNSTDYISDQALRRIRDTKSTQCANMIRDNAGNSLPKFVYRAMHIFETFYQFLAPTSSPNFTAITIEHIKREGKIANCNHTYIFM